MGKMIGRIVKKVFGELPEFNPDSERNNWIIDRLLEIPEGESILDAGAGTQPYRKYCSKLKYISQDFCEYDGGGNGIGLQVGKGKFDIAKIDIIGDIVDIPVADESFDNILCSEVLEHIPVPELAIKEFARILTRGGGADSDCPIWEFDTLCSISLLHWF